MISLYLSIFGSNLFLIGFSKSSTEIVHSISGLYVLLVTIVSPGFLLIFLLHPPIFEGSATLPQTRLGLQFGGRQSHKGSSNGGSLLKKYRELINAFIGLA
jgi:hypothetical protein